VSEIASWWLVAVVVEITAAARAKITVTATHGGTSFSTLRHYSVDHTIRAGKRQTFFDDEVGRIYRVVVDRRPMPRRVAPSVERFGETSLDRSFPIFSAVRDCPRRPRNDGT
jgi:hypothetical protein